jgi:hypothetical protein
VVFYKRVLLLKEATVGFSSSNSPVSGILRLEQEDFISSLSLTLINVKENGGEYRLFICFDKRTIFSFPLGTRPFSFSEKVDFFPSADGGFSAGVVFIKDMIPTVVAFAKSDECSMLLKDFKKCALEKLIKEAESKVVYDDEVVATENYFPAHSLEKTFNLAKDINLDYVQNKDALFTCLGKEQTAKTTANDCCRQNETNDPNFTHFNEQNPYYITVKKNLEQTFSKFPKADDLNKLTPDGNWVKINYSKDKFYVVGIIKEKGKERYICYGVPSKYQESPPKELQGFASFVPLSVFNLKGDGYYIMFQDAITGKSVKIN